MEAIKETNFTFPGQTNFYRGKVRDIYFFDEVMAMIASDRLSAFDVVLPRAIPYKGAILNMIAAKALEATKDIIPNWVIESPHPRLTVGRSCETYPVEMVIRGYLAGHAWREYAAGKRVLCGVDLPDGLKENDKLPEPIITPTTKAHEGHDEDISREEILLQGLVSEDEYRSLENYTRQLFQRGTEIAAKQGLILVDTKYEFGHQNGVQYLIDEIHTPDSSRYFYGDTYASLQEKGERQKQLSKEFVREWLMANGFQGKDGQQIPEMTDEVVNSISSRYIELYEKVTGEKFDISDISDNLENCILASIEEIKTNS